MTVSATGTTKDPASICTGEKAFFAASEVTSHPCRDACANDGAGQHLGHALRGTPPPKTKAARPSATTTTVGHHKIDTGQSGHDIAKRLAPGWGEIDCNIIDRHHSQDRQQALLRRKRENRQHDESHKRLEAAAAEPHQRAKAAGAGQCHAVTKHQLHRRWRR